MKCPKCHEEIIPMCPKCGAEIRELKREKFWPPFYENARSWRGVMIFPIGYSINRHF